MIVFIQNYNSKQVYQSAYENVTVAPNILTAIEDLENVEDFLVYPNPANQVVNIDFGKPLQSKYSWNIYDMLGKLLIQALFYPERNF